MGTSHLLWSMCTLISVAHVLMCVWFFFRRFLYETTWRRIVCTTGAGSDADSHTLKTSMKKKAVGAYDTSFQMGIHFPETQKNIDYGALLGAQSMKYFVS